MQRGFAPLVGPGKGAATRAMSSPAAPSALPLAREQRPVPRWAGSLMRLPLLIKVLLANAAVVLLGAVVGTRLTMLITRASHSNDDLNVGLAMVFALVGVILSVGVNYFLLRAAFRPLTSMEEVAAAIRRGDLSARAMPDPTGDAQLAYLATTFNQTLDELERDRRELRLVASQVINAQEEERKRIARELHDDTAQILFAQLLRLSTLKASAVPEIRRTAATMEEMTVEALEAVRRLALELRPPALDDLGLHAALADLAQRFSEQLRFPVELTITGPRTRKPPEVELVLYRVAQEALTNIGKHASATRVEITLSREAGRVSLRVRDDGVGFDPARETERDGRGLGLGMFGMAERASLVGGTFTVHSAPGAGTEIIAEIPIEPAWDAGMTTNAG